MWMGKIGNKSAAFINHKHFHPGNYKNLEQVWIAEEKHKAALKRQKEMKEKRDEELKISEIKRQLREQEALKIKEMQLEEKKYVVKSSQLLNSEEYGLILPKQSSTSSGTKKVNEPKLIIQSQYKEDVFINGHTAVFGSFFDMKTNAWGYKCCKEMDKNGKCSVNVVNEGDVDADLTKKRKSDTNESDEPIKSTEKKKKIKSLHETTLMDTLSRLKKLDALD